MVCKAPVNDDALDVYLNEIGKIPLLSKEEEKEIGRQIKEGDLSAKEKLIGANLRFVASIARKFQGMGLSLEDLICEGNIGLMRAVKKYDPEKQNYFADYGKWWIWKYIGWAIHRNHHEGVFLPLELETEDGEEIESSCLEDERFNPENIVGMEMMRNYIKSALDSAALSSKEEGIIIERYGLNEERGSKSLEEVGLLYNITKERVRQIEEKALKKLRRSVKIQRLRDYI
jgi:RNA polymerase primary sigma factor